MYKSWETIGQFLKVFSPCNKMLFIYFFMPSIGSQLNHKKHTQIGFTQSSFTKAFIYFIYILLKLFLPFSLFLYQWLPPGSSGIQTRYLIFWVEL